MCLYKKALAHIAAGEPMSSNIVQAFYRHSVEAPDSLAVFVDSRKITYEELAVSARKNSSWLLYAELHG